MVIKEDGCLMSVSEGFNQIREYAQVYLVAVTIATELPPDAPLEEYKAVIDVIRNRVKSGRWGKLAVDVVLARNQFSAVCRETYWRNAVAGNWLPSHVERCLNLWTVDWADTTDGAMYYYSPISMIPQWSAPAWAASLVEVTVEGTRPTHFKFFKEK